LGKGLRSHERSCDDHCVKRVSLVVVGALLLALTGACGPPIVYPATHAPDPPGGQPVENLASLLVDQPPSTVEIMRPEAPNGTVPLDTAVKVLGFDESVVTLDVLKSYGFKRAVYRAWKDEATNVRMEILLIEFDGPLGAAKWTHDVQGVYGDPDVLDATAELDSIDEGRTFVLKAEPDGTIHTESIFGHGRVSARIDMLIPSGQPNLPMLNRLSELQYDKLP
jgi:hypothetical protein